MIKKALKGKIEISGWGYFKLVEMDSKNGGAPGLTRKGHIQTYSLFKGEKAEIYKATYKFLDCKDYLTYKLTGKIVTV